MLRGMDSETLRKVAKLARSRARPPRQYDHGDGLERLGAERALEQFARDLEVSADHCGEQGED
jgi:hypothetical protein